MTLINDTYKTIKNISEGIYREKGSKFIAIAFPIETEEEIKEKLQELRKSYHDARHHCYAYILGFDKSIYRINDDGEPSGTAGRPIYRQLLSHDVTNILVVVVRYFGGTKLGVSGLINAYKIATKEALAANEIIEKQVEEKYYIGFNPINMNRVMRILKSDDVKIIKHYYDKQQIIIFQVRKRDKKRVLTLLSQIEELNYKKENI